MTGGCSLWQDVAIGLAVWLVAVGAYVVILWRLGARAVRRAERELGRAREALRRAALE